MLVPRSDSSQLCPAIQGLRLQHRLFDISEFMRNVQGAFLRWYNQTYTAKAGSQRTFLLHHPRRPWNPYSRLSAYVELNAVRAGLTTHPEEYEWSSLYLREAGQDDWLMPLRDPL